MSAQRLAATCSTAVDLLDEVAEAHPDREAFVDGEKRLTFAGWREAAEGVAAAMAAAGVSHGDVVCLALPSSTEYAICYQAAMRLGAITSGLNTRLGPVELASILRRTEPRLLITETGPGTETGATTSMLAALEATPVRAPRPTIWGIDEVRQAARAGASTSGAVRPNRRTLRASDAVAIVWTSGTTGEPKGAVFDHASLSAMALGAGPLSAQGDRRLSPLPFAHVGYMTRMWDELEHVITTVIVPSPWRAEEALRLIAAERVTVAQGVPAQWSLMLAHAAATTTDFSSLRLAATGAASASPELIRRMRERLGCPVIVRYASTEASLATGSVPGDTDEVVATTVGRPSGGVELQLVDDDGVPVPAGEVGTVRLRSGAVMRGYWRDPERTASVLSPDGWLTTGDLGCLDAGGNLTLVGRRSEMYIRGGYNVYPAEVETVLSEHPEVGAVAVVGVPDDVLGEIGAAFIVPAGGAATLPEDGGAPPDLDSLRTWCRGRLADYKAPDRLFVVDELPLTAMNKVDKRALAATAERTSVRR